MLVLIIRTEDAPFTRLYFLSKLDSKCVLIPSYALGDKLFDVLEELQLKKARCENYLQCNSVHATKSA